MDDGDRKRIVWLDNFKAIGIISIVFFHIRMNVAFFDYFFVPMFYFASGFTFKYNGIHLLKKIRRFYLPFLITNIIHVLLHNPLYLLGIYSNPINLTQTFQGIFQSFLFNISEHLNTQCWFLFSIFCISIFYYVLFHVTQLLNKKYADLIMTLVCFGLFVTGLILAPQLSSILWGNCAIITNILTGMIFYQMGYLIKKYCIVDKISPLLAIVSFLSALTALIIIYMKFDYTCDYRAGLFSNLILSCIIPYCGIWISIFISKFISHIWVLSHAVSYIGRNTMPILLFHTLSFQLIGIFQINILNYPRELLTTWVYTFNEGVWCYIIAMTGIIVPLICNILIKKTIQSLHRIFRKG